MFFGAQFAFGHITTNTPPAASEGTYQHYTFFASSTAQTDFATTTTATSTNITPWFNSDGRYDNGAFNIAGAKKVTFYFSRGDTTGEGNTGSTLFEVQVTPDGTNWYDFNKLVQNLATSTTPTTLGGVTISAATSTVIVSLDIEDDTFYATRCIVKETTDGEHSCSASANW